MRTGVRFMAATAAFAAACALPAAPAFAGKPPPPVACGSVNLFSDGSNAIAPTGCSGFFSGNLLNNANEAAQQTAVNGLGGAFTDWNDYDVTGLHLEGLDGNANSVYLQFGQQLFGDTILGVHLGAGAGWATSTAFFSFNFDTPQDGIWLNTKGSSNAVLYQTGTPTTGAVPEPATWALMLFGFGASGFAMRRQKQKLQEILQTA